MKKNITLAENGHLRGKELLAKYGPDHFREMGRKSAAVRAKKGPHYYRNLGKKGSASLLKKDPNHMKKMHAKRWNKKYIPSTMDYLLGKA